MRNHVKHLKSERVCVHFMSSVKRSMVFFCENQDEQEANKDDFPDVGGASREGRMVKVPDTKEEKEVQQIGKSKRDNVPFAQQQHYV